MRSVLVVACRRGGLCAFAVGISVAVRLRLRVLVMLRRRAMGFVMRATLRRLLAGLVVGRCVRRLRFGQPFHVAALQVVTRRDREEPALLFEAAQPRALLRRGSCRKLGRSRAVERSALGVAEHDQQRGAAVRDREFDARERGVGQRRLWRADDRDLAEATVKEVFGHDARVAAREHDGERLQLCCGRPTGCRTVAERCAVADEAAVARLQRAQGNMRSHRRRHDFVRLHRVVLADRRRVRNEPAHFAGGGHVARRAHLEPADGGKALQLGAAAQAFGRGRGRVVLDHGFQRLLGRERAFGHAMHGRSHAREVFEQRRACGDRRRVRCLRDCERGRSAVVMAEHDQGGGPEVLGGVFDRVHGGRIQAMARGAQHEQLPEALAEHELRRRCGVGAAQHDRFRALGARGGAPCASAQLGRRGFAAAEARVALFEQLHRRERRWRGGRRRFGRMLGNCLEGAEASGEQEVRESCRGHALFLVFGFANADPRAHRLGPRRIWTVAWSAPWQGNEPRPGLRGH